MPVITISATLGAGAKEIGQLVAARLGIQYVDREAMVLAARELGVPENTPAGRVDKPSSFGERLSSMLRGLLERSAATGPADPFMGSAGLEILLNRTYSEASAGSAEDQRYQEIMATVVKNLAQAGQVVIQGRGAQAILAGDPSAVHVFINAPVERRAERLVARDGNTREQAEKRIRDSDRARAEFHRKYFKVDHLDPMHYQLMLNTARCADDEAADVIAAAGKARVGRG